MKESNIDWSYIAGVMDADGWFSIKVGSGRKSPKFEIRIGVSNTDRKMVDFLQKQLGGTINTRKRVNENWKQEYRWELGNKKAAFVIRNIEDLLVVKAERATVCLEMQASIDVRKGDSLGLDVGVINYRLGLKEELSKLNERGVQV